MKISKIISGGQTGADRGGLEAAIEAGLAHGGYCPRGRRSEAGRIPSRYKLTETNTANYLVRTERNILAADGTILFTYGQPTGGSQRTALLARKHKRALKHADLRNEDSVLVASLLAWLDTSHKEGLTINVAGSRESKNPGIEWRVKKLLLQVLEKSRAS